MARGPGKGVSNNPAGKPKGTKNATTIAIKEIYIDILNKEQKHWPKILEMLRQDNPYQYMMVMDKISQKVIANKKDITSDDKPIQPAINISEHRAEPETD